MKIIFRMMLHRTFLFHDLHQLLMKLKESEFIKHMQLSITTEIFSIMHHIFLIKQLTRKPFGTYILNLKRLDLDIWLTIYAYLQNMFSLTWGRGRCRASRGASCWGRSLISICFSHKYMFRNFQSHLMM